LTEQMEYLFFNADLAKRFAAFCQQQQIEAMVTQEASFTEDNHYNVSIKDTTDSEALERIEAYYNELFFGDQAAEVEGHTQAGVLADACGVQVQLQSGEFTTVAIHPEIMNKLLSVLTIDELQHFLSQVSEDIENPKNEVDFDY